MNKYLVFILIFTCVGCMTLNPLNPDPPTPDPPTPDPPTPDPPTPVNPTNGYQFISKILAWSSGYRDIQPKSPTETRIPDASGTAIEVIKLTTLQAICIHTYNKTVFLSFGLSFYDYKGNIMSNYTQTGLSRFTYTGWRNDDDNCVHGAVRFELLELKKINANMFSSFELNKQYNMVVSVTDYYHQEQKITIPLMRISY